MGEQKRGRGRPPLFGVSMTKREISVRSSATQRRVIREVVADEKLRRGACAVCGIAVTPDNLVIFDFDHRDRATKRRQVSQFGTQQGLREEMDKCDLLCANCHRLRTYAERHWTPPQVDHQPVADSLF